MDNTQLQYIKIQSQYIDKLEKFEKCIIKAAKAAHSLADTAEKKMRAGMGRVGIRQHGCYAEYNPTVYFSVRTGLGTFSRSPDTAYR